ncbi:MAG: OST3/OST6 family protein [Candidatus Bathyarchaeota archaeon]|jgi:hypothetical protein|nr:OST3/OST6 family protein [Candidatus Bathyarchaeota archaeon]
MSSYKMKKKQEQARSSSVPFSLSRWFRKLSTNAPSAALVTIAGISYAIFLFGGGLFTLITQPQASGYYSGRFLFIYPSLSGQFIADTIISITLYALGFIGLLAIYRSTKSAYNPRQAYMMLIIGVTFLLLAYIFLEGAILSKAGS